MPSRSGVAASLLFLTITLAVPAPCLAADGASAEPYSAPWQNPAFGRLPFGGRQAQQLHVPPQYDLHANGHFFQRPVSSVPGDELWWDGFALPSTDGNVFCVVDYQGSIIVAGLFTQVGGVPANNIASWDGTNWHPVGAGTDGVITDLYVFHGDLIVAGEFFTADGVPAIGIAQWDGHTWSPMGAGLQEEYGYPPVTFAMTEYDGDLFVGGSFSNSGAIALNHVARWDGASWSAVGAGFDGQVNALAVNADTLYAGGAFLTSGGSPDSLVAQWNGSSWGAVGNGLTAEIEYGYLGQVYGMSSYHGHIVATGDLAFYSDSTVSNIVEWDGGVWTGLGSSLNPTRALAVMQDTLYVLGGSLMSWAGNAWSSHPDIQGYGQSMFSDGSNLWIVGYVSAVDPSGNPAFSIIRYSDGIGHDLTAWNDHMRGLSDGLGPGTVSSLVEYKGNLIASGGFEYAGEPPHWVDVHGLAEWNGSHWLAMPPPPNNGGYHPPITTTLVQGDTLYAGGIFEDSTFATIPVYRFTSGRWTPLGQSSFEPEAMTMYRGHLVAGGRTFGPYDSTAIYEWDGGTWRTIGSATGVFAMVTSLKEWDGKLLAAGRFTSVDGVSVTNIATWDGSHWEPFGNRLPTGTVGYGGAGVTSYQGAVIAAGLMSSVLRWNGSAWELMGDLLTDDAIPFVVGNELFLGGNLRTQSPPYRQFGVAHWNGRQWDELGSGTNGPVRAALAHNGSLFLGGQFTFAGGKGSYGIARWDGLPAPIAKAALLPAAPNPFRASTTFSYALPASGSVRVSVFDLRGREIVVLQKGSQPQGMHAVTWNGRDDEGRTLPSGVYFLRADLPGGEFSRKIVHLR